MPVLSPELFLNTHSIPYFSLYLVAMCPIGNVITQLFHRVHSLSFLYMPKPYAGPTVSFTKCPPWSRGVLGPRALKYTAFTFNHVYLERNPTCEMLICASVWYPLNNTGAIIQAALISTLQGIDVKLTCFHQIIKTYFNFHTDSQEKITQILQ